MMNTNEDKANSLGSQTGSAADVSTIADSEERVDFEDDLPEEDLDENALLEEDKWFAANWEDDPFDDLTSDDLSLDDALFFAQETSEEEEFVCFSAKMRQSPPRTRGQAHRAEVPPFQSLMSQERRDFLRAASGAGRAQFVGTIRVFVSRRDYDGTGNETRFSVYSRNGE